MKRLLICLLTVGLLSSFAPPLHAQDAEKLFQQGLIKEEGEGNLTEAIDIYTQLVNDSSVDRTLQANALMHIGICYEKLGKNNAQDAYQRIITEYPEQTQLTEIAKRKLKLLKIPQIDNLNKEEGLSTINLYKKGSWMENSTLSPDGTKLAGIDFSIGQNVKIYDLITNESQMLTEYKWTTEPYGITYNPTWSPNGKEIVYLFANSPGVFELQASTLQGKKRTLIKNEKNAGRIYPRQWSNDRTKILTFKQDSTGYYTIGLVPSEGGAFKALHKTKWKKRFVEGDASLSPDGKYVVLSDGKTDNFDLFIINTETGISTVLSNYPTDELEPLWSPDGKHVVFIRETKGGSFLYGIKISDGKPVGNPFLIKEGMQNVNLVNWTEQGITYDYVMDLRDIYTLALDPDTGIPKGEPKPLDYTPTGSNISPAWSHNGKFLAFISYDDKPEVVIMNGKSKEKRHYPLPDVEFWSASVYDLRWLPDNSGVSFNLLNRMQESSIYKLDINSGEWQDWPLIKRGWTRTDWGPDNNSFVFNKPNKGLHQFNIKTGESKKIFNPDTSKVPYYNIRGLKFSRDHKKLTFMMQSSPKNKGLMILDLESGKSKDISQKLRSPTFSPDGEKILAFEKKFGVAVVSLKGKILQQYNLDKYFIPKTRIYDPDWSPDGKQLTFPVVYWKSDTYLLKNVLK